VGQNHLALAIFVVVVGGGGGLLGSQRSGGDFIH
jgi:hypothetical protein